MLPLLAVIVCQVVRRRASWLAACCALVACAAVGTEDAQASIGKFQIKVVDADTGEQLAARLHLKDQRGNRRRAPSGAPALGDHFEFDRPLELELPVGSYTYELSCGPEYRSLSGHFRIQVSSNDNETVKMQRIVDMNAQGWWSGDLYVARPARELPLLLLANGLNLAEVVTWDNTDSQWTNAPLPNSPVVEVDPTHYYHLLAGRDAPGGAGLTIHGLGRPTPTSGAAGTPGSVAAFAKQAREQGAFIELDAPYAWDTPVWIAQGVVDGVRLLGPHLQRDGITERAAGYRPRHRTDYEGPAGLGRYTQEIYYHLLNVGLRLPPTAGSGSGTPHPVQNGKLETPIGYNRVYVQQEGTFGYNSWWENLRRGQAMVTNGPLLRPRANGRLPGHVFTAPAGQTLASEITLDLAFEDKVEYLEIVQNGYPVHHVRLDEFAKADGRLPLVEFSTSGWFLVRAITNVPKTYRFASSAPWYVEIGDEPYVSKRSAKFFLDWIYERAAALDASDPEKHRAALIELRDARNWWLERLKQATAD